MKSARVGVVVACAFVLGVSAGRAQPRALTQEETVRLEQCIRSDDHHCVIAMLEGRPFDAAQGHALFSAQREIGDRWGACRTGRTLADMEDVPAARRSMIRQYIRSLCQ